MYALHFWIFMVSCLSLLRANEDSDEQCKKDLQKAASCYVKELEKTVKNERKWREHTNNISLCFNQSHCDAPSFGRNPLSGMPSAVRKLGNKIKEEWTNTSKAVKRCIRQQLAEKMGEEVSKCLSRKNVENFNFSHHLSSDGPVGGDNPLDSFVTGDGASGNSSKATSKEMKKLMAGVVNLVRSIRICNETKNAAAVEKCVKQQCSSVKEDYCQNAVKCRGKANSTKSDCQSHGEAIYTALCQCKQEKLREMVENLDRVRHRDNVALGEMIKALSQGQDLREYLLAIRQCYRENNERVPPILAVAMVYSEKAEKGEDAKKEQTQEGAKKEKFEFWVDKSSMDTIRDFLASQCFDEDECTLCS